MPPQRTVPPARPVKTERTHEENQERAYIAASRRSDRSLEARVESARRASEIHKRRTGRSLRVTEADVVNEEMYEEEDDDLPFRYRHLTSHLQTDSELFNRRLQAYLTNQMGIRSAMDQYVTNQYAQQFPNASQYAHNQSAMFQSSAMGPGFPMQVFQHQMSPMTHLNGPFPMYRPAPYPMSNLQQGGQRPVMTHARPASISGPQMASLTSQDPTSPIDDKRRMSLASSPTPMESAKLPQTPQVVTSGTPKTQSAVASPAGRNQIPEQQPLAQGYMVFPQYTLGNFADPSSDALFSAALPPESQQLLGSTLDPRDPMTAMLMAGSSYLPQPSFNLNDHNNGNAGPASTDTKLGMGIGAAAFPSFDGLNSTLAPGDIYNNEFIGQPQPSYFEEGMEEAIVDGLSGTPGGFNAEFNLFIDPDQWVEVPSSSQ